MQVSLHCARRPCQQDCNNRRAARRLVLSQIRCQLPVRRHQVIHGKRRIGRAGIGGHKNSRLPYAVSLQTPLNVSRCYTPIAHKIPVRQLAVEPGALWLILFDKPAQTWCSCAIVACSEIGSTARWSFHQVGESHTLLFQQPPHCRRTRLDRFTEQTAGVQYFPETVTRIGKIEPCRHRW